MIVSYIQGFQDIYIYTCIFFFQISCLKTIPFWCPILGPMTSRSFSLRRHLTRFMKPGKSLGAREVKVVLAFSPCLLCSPFLFPFDGRPCFHHVFFELFWGGLELWWSECAGCATTSICGSKDVGFMVNWSQEPCHLWWMPSWCGDSFGLLEYSPGQAARFLQETNRFHRFHSCFRVHRRTFSSQKRVELTTWGFSTS